MKNFLLTATLMAGTLISSGSSAQTQTGYKCYSYNTDMTVVANLQKSTLTVLDEDGNVLVKETKAKTTYQFVETYPATTVIKMSAQRSSFIIKAQGEKAVASLDDIDDFSCKVY